MYGAHWDDMRRGVCLSLASAATLGYANVVSGARVDGQPKWRPLFPRSVQLRLTAGGTVRSRCAACSEAPDDDAQTRTLLLSLKADDPFPMQPGDGR